MKRSIWIRVLAMILIVSMLPVPASAASWDSRSGKNRSGWGWSWGSFWDYWFGGSDEEEETEPVETEPAQTEPVETEASSDAVMTLVEDASTVDNGAGLRASTYALTRDASATTTTKVVYFPVTMYNYKGSDINGATDALDDDLTVREGLYFTGGSPEYTKSTDADMSAFVAGQYYIQNIRASENRTDGATWLQAHEDNKIYAVTKDNATVWTLVIENDEYYLTCDIEGVTYYMVVGTNGDTDGYTTTKTPIEIVAYSGNASGVQLRQNGYYLCQWGGVDVQNFGGYDVNNDGGNGMLFYPVDSDTPIAPGAGVTKIVSGYEEWNRWDKAAGSNAYGDLIYTGLVQQTMVDDQIVFNVPEGGIFNSDTSVKDIYEYVGLPFVLNTETGVYSFDSDENGAYFEGDPQSGSIDEFGNVTAHNLHFAEGVPQPMPTDLSVGDGSTNAFFPYNNQSSYVTSQVDYHFGMRADLPFSMTPNGRVKSTDDESAPITFTFSGDDDVWVFIDGHLVIDLGGIHNRLDATINFAENTITYSEENAADTDNSTASYNDSSFAMTQQLFTADGVEGVIPMSRDAFALDPDHEMQVFYLERGEGTSNCRIEFNLPMNDTVLVTKDATQSWSRSEEEDNPDVEDAGVSQLTAAEQAIINNIDFGFTLYKKTADSDAFEPVANTNFYLVGRAVEGVVINQTDANGHFYLKNGQSAKFITEIPTEGVTYYVVEDKVPDGFVSPDFNFAGEATYDYSYTDGTVSGTASAADASEIPEQIIDLPTENEDGTLTWAENKSYEVTVKGSVEANDSIEFICSNYLDNELPNPTALTYEDIIVIDYGLPVNIDPLANDVFRGDNIEIVYFGNDNVNLTESTGADGVVTAAWDGEQEFHSGSVVLNDVGYAVDAKGNVTRDTFTYTLNKQLTEVEVITYIIKVTGQEKQEATEATLTQYDYAIGKIYIVPATVMYYEENFTGLVTFKSGNGVWDEVATTDASAVSANQEPGVVGTVGDSTYGSDVAYLSDSGDSNGTSRYGDTTNGAIQFTYTFTGTGTSFFARTSATTGYMQVKIYEGTEIISDALLDLTYRDTYYEDTNGSDEDITGTLYNIPVYTNEDLDYGTYTVVATIAKAGTKGAGAVGDDGYQHAGKDFYLDGIRIVQPLNMHVTGYTEDENEYPIYDAITEKALGAYATDGEANVDIVTLRYKLITDAETEDNWNFVVLTDTNGEITTAEDYTSIGPKEEVYLLPGQSVSFAIKYWHKDGYLLHLGMKAPFGTASAQVGQTTFNLENATDCYYNITGMQSSIVSVTDEDGYTYYVATYTISATDRIVSLTNLKVTGNYEFALIEDVNIDFNGSVGEDTDGENGDTDVEVTE